MSGPAVGTDLSTIEALDFEPACEHSEHHLRHVGDMPAVWIKSTVCPNCLRSKDMNICDPGRHYWLTSKNILCQECMKAAPIAAWAAHWTPLGRDS